jgi:prepilin-type N-terminal cleavage/methylation domain-containing protein
MSRTSVHSSRARGGFTLVELMVSLSISAVVIGGVLSAYIFLGRNLGRMVNVQHQMMQSRRTLEMFKKDVGQASALTTATAAQVVLTKPVSSGTATVTYSYDSAAGKLDRTEVVAPATSGTPLTIVSGLTAFTFSYYNSGGTAVTSSAQSVKSVEFAYTSTNGSANGSTLTTFNSVSPRIVLRNKPILQ